MSSTPVLSANGSQLRRTCGARATLVWEMLTAPSGVEEWMISDGFESRVTQLELRPGGRLRYVLTASAPEQVAFVQDLGLAVSSQFQRTYTEVSASCRLAYLSLIDFIPGEQPYEHLTVVEIEPTGNRTTLLMTLDPLHDKTWTEQYREHRDGELDRLAAAIERRTGSGRGSVWRTARSSARQNRPLGALLLAGIGVSMALPAVPSAVLARSPRARRVTRPRSTTWPSASAPY